MKHIFSVTQINSYIHRIFESDYALKKIYLKGEVSNCKYHSSGHIYFTLKDEKSTLRCVMFSSDRFKGLAFHLEDGQLIEACGNISVYEQAGTYQLYVRKIELAGAGELYVRYERLKQELAEKGYFDFERKKPLPAYPEKIGIVTALTGAAIEDIRSIARRRNQTVQLYLYPAKVQGEGASAEIARGIRYFDKAGVDIIIIGRGGGSIEDLWAFNEEITARAIFNSNIPIISAVGHETDFTIADFVADLRAPTPSAAAEIAVPSMIELRNRINTDKNRISQNIVKRIESCKLLLKRFKMRTPKDRIDDYYLKIDSLVKSMDNCIKMKTMSLRRQLAERAAKLDALSPLQTLSRGYSIPTKEDGTVIRSANDMEKGMEFTLRMKDGQTNCVVKGE